MNYALRVKNRLAGWWSMHGNWFKFGLASASVGVLIGLISLFALVYTGSPGGPGSGYNGTDTENQDQPAVETPAEDSGQASPSGSNKLNRPTPPRPANVLNLTNWKLTLPVDTSRSGSPDEIKQPGLASYINNNYFRLNSTKSGVVFIAPVDGATTSGSSYPRSELREMTNNGKNQASWSNLKGTHTMTVKEAIFHLPSAKPQVVAAQIHDSEDDVIMIRLDGSSLYVEADGDSIGSLSSSYKLGTVYTVKIVASGGHIKVYYNGKLKVDYRKGGSGYYFKAGCYTQSNTSKGDRPGAYGEVRIYGLQVSHK